MCWFCKTITCAMLAYSPETTLSRKVIYNVVWVCLGEHRTRKFLCSDSTWITENFYEENNPCNVVLFMLGKHCTGVLFSQCCLNLWVNMALGNYFWEVGPVHTFIFFQENNLYNCFDLPGPTLHKKMTCAMLVHSPQITSQRKIF